jgi:hydroxyacylglutathione hydrolase
MQIITIVCQPLGNNTYLVIDGDEAIVIDPSYGSTSKILEQTKGVKIKYIINTHGHPDHTWENQKLKEKTHTKLLIHKADAHLLKNPEFDTPIPFVSSDPDEFLENDQEIILGKLKFKVIHTPGHSPGGVCLYEEKEKILFSGDTLFKGTYGRTDLHHSDSKEMQNSLKKLMQLSDDVKVYPGHGKETTIGEERKWVEQT